MGYLSCLNSIEHSVNALSKDFLYVLVMESLPEAKSTTSQQREARKRDLARRMNVSRLSRRVQNRCNRHTHILCMYVCICLYIHARVYMYMYIYIYVYMYICIYVCMYICMYVCMYVGLYVWHRHRLCFRVLALLCNVTFLF